jgi:hypothetical protein
VTEQPTSDNDQPVLRGITGPKLNLMVPLYFGTHPRADIHMIVSEEDAHTLAGASEAARRELGLFFTMIQDGVRDFLAKEPHPPGDGPDEPDEGESP